MATVRVLVIRAAGINCEDELMDAWRLAGGVPHLIHIHRLIEDPARINDFQVLAIPGGFSYGDDVSAGKILANQILHFLRDRLRMFVDGGGLLLGICNGFQVLVKAGLLPSATNESPAMTVWRNRSGKYEDRWVRLRATTDRCPFLVRDAEMFVPVAHAEGRVVLASGGETDRTHTALRYIGSDAAPPRYPANPNGSDCDIAGVTDDTGRILGLMPHPERFVHREQHPYWTRLQTEGEPSGLTFFKNAVAFLR